MNTTITSGQLQNFLILLDQKGMNPERFQKLLSNGILADVCDAKANLDRLAVQEGLKHLIDCSTDPFIPDGWSVEEHQKGSELEWNPASLTLYLSETQKHGWIVGNDLRKELKGKPVLNACVLDYLLAHPELIPEDWKGKAVFFWGTIYRDSNGRLCVRCLCWSGAGWVWYCFWLDGGWRAHDPALLLASIPKS